MKNLIILIFIALIFTSCEKDNFESAQWKAQVSSTNYKSLSFPTHTIGWAVGYNGTILRLDV